MANTQLTRQIGEHLVVSELGRHGIIATPFSGNMPDFDVVALAPSGDSLYIQVKAINTGDWQLDAKHFLLVEYDKETDLQAKLGLRPSPITPLVFVFVKIIQSGQDEFYVLSYSDVRKIVESGYRRTKGKSFHFALRRNKILEFKVDDLRDVAQAIERQAEQAGCTEPRDSVSVAGRASQARGR
jgi:hypothetical protein